MQKSGEARCGNLCIRDAADLHLQCMWVQPGVQSWLDWNENLSFAPTGLEALGDENQFNSIL